MTTHRVFAVACIALWLQGCSLAGPAADKGAGATTQAEVAKQAMDPRVPIAMLQGLRRRLGPAHRTG